MQVKAPGATAAEPGPEEAVIAAMMSVGRLMKTRMADGVDPGTHHLLHNLRCAGAQRITDLAALCRLDTSTVSRHVATLERNGLVVRTPHPEDGRAMAVDLTPAGQAALDQAMQARKELLAGLLADWPRSEVETFARLLTVFAAGADARRSELSDEPATKPLTKTPLTKTPPTKTPPTTTSETTHLEPPVATRRGSATNAELEHA